MVGRFYAHNTHRSDFVHFTKLLFVRLLNRGWTTAKIKPIFVKAVQRAEAKRGTTSTPYPQPTTHQPTHNQPQPYLPTNPATTNQPQPSQLPADTTNRRRRRLFLHIQYHPDDISRPHLRRLYEEHLGGHVRAQLRIERPIIAYSRPRSIGDYIVQAKLHEAPGRDASTIMGEYTQGLDP